MAPLGEDDPTSPANLQRERSVTMAAIESNRAAAAKLIATMSAKPHKTNPEVDGFAVEIPKGCIFVGHLNTDMDSIGSSIGAAHLFDGIALSASKINSETAFALEYWGLDTPDLFETYKGGTGKVCLMDHNQVSQIAKGVDLNSICGVIDHHALQNGTVITDRPVYIDIRPWGSACTIVAHTYLRIRKPIPPKIAGILLSGILSDTLNLRSPTTTDHDRLVVAVLAEISGCKDIDDLSDQQFVAKSEALNHLSPYEVAGGDQKKFNMEDKDGNPIAIGIGVVETTNPGGMINRIDELMIEVAALKSEQKLDYSYLAIVDIIELTSTLLLIGKAETELAVQAFGEEIYSPNNDGVGTMKIDGKVSRKKDFVPVLTSTIASGFKPSAPALAKTAKQKEVVVEDVYGTVEKEWSLEACCAILVRKIRDGRKDAFKRVSSFSSMATPGGGWSNIIRNISNNSLTGGGSRKNSFSELAKEKGKIEYEPPFRENPLPREEPAPSKDQAPPAAQVPVAVMAASALGGALLAVLIMKVTARK
mmetsp:Transcript_14943/g.29760  ORF Transcript_14943/g.29760 Transcript_14943/m.29760 type:complete len:534 (-) Transcript_14943:72-1673(-)